MSLKINTYNASNTHNVYVMKFIVNIDILLHIIVNLVK